MSAAGRNIFCNIVLKYLKVIAEIQKKVRYDKC